MDKRSLSMSTPAGFVLGSLVAAAPGRAESQSTQVDQITCAACLAMTPDDQQRSASWVDGSQAATGEAAGGVVVFDTCGQPIGVRVDVCQTAPKETLWHTITKHLESAVTMPGKRSRLREERGMNTRECHILSLVVAVCVLSTIMWQKVP